MGISPDTQRFVQKSTHTHTHTQTIPQVLITRGGIRSLRFYMLKASKCSLLRVKAYPSIYKSTFFKELLAHSPSLPLWTGMLCAQGSFITLLETYCWSEAEHAWSSPEILWATRRQVFPLLTRSCINEYAGRRLILMLHYVNIRLSQCISHPDQSR